MEWTNEKVINEIKKAGGKEVKYENAFDVLQRKKKQDKASWKDYKKEWLNEDYTRNKEDIEERLRVKFYRAQDIYERIGIAFKKSNSENYDSFFDGYVAGAKYDKDTESMLYFIYRKINLIEI